MKIAIEAQRIFRKKKHGMDIVALELIRHLQQIDRVNEYFILVKPDTDNKVLEETPNFHIIEIPGGPYPVWEQYHLPKALKKIKPDILHCTSNTAPLYCNTPLILTLHDIIFMTPSKEGKGSRYQHYGNIYRRWLVPHILNKCGKIITVSDFEKQKIEQYFQLPEGKVSTVYNAYTNTFRRIEDVKLLKKYREKYALPEQFILFLGNTDPKKNSHNVLRAFDILCKKSDGNIHLVMPDADQSFLENVIGTTENSDVRNAIHLTGYIPNHELVYIYNMASLFLYPSLYESFGIPLLEAMACGTPVITSKQAAMPEIAGNAAMLTDPHKPEEIAHAIERLLNNDGLRQNYIEAGLQRVNSFHWGTTARKALAIYQDVYGQIKQSNLINCIA